MDSGGTWLRLRGFYFYYDFYDNVIIISSWFVTSLLSLGIFRLVKIFSKNVFRVKIRYDCDCARRHDWGSSSELVPGWFLWNSDPSLLVFDQTHSVLRLNKQRRFVRSLDDFLDPLRSTNQIVVSRLSLYWSNLKHKIRPRPGRAGGKGADGFCVSDFMKNR